MSEKKMISRMISRFGDGAILDARGPICRNGGTLREGWV